MKKLPILFAALLAASSLGACTVIGDVDTVGGGNNTGGDGGLDGGVDAPGDGGLTSAQLRLAFGKCMTLAEWDANNIGQIALTVGTPPTPCSDAACHGGLQKPTLTATSANTFNATILDDISLASYVIANAGQLTQSQVFITEGVAGSGHPLTYTLAANINLTNFFNLTKARYDLNAGNCPPPL